MSDLNLLKAVVDNEGVSRPDTWTTSDDAVQAVLRLLYESSEAFPLWTEIYEALKVAYVGDADWGDE